MSECHDDSGARAKRPFLVVIRAGDQSLHRTWMKKDAARQWDLLIDYYGAHDDYRDELADFTFKGGVAKYPSIRAFDRANVGLLRSYRALSFLDDDIEIAFEDIDRMFAIFTSHDLWLAQPSLSRDSFYSHAICLHCEQFELRYTNFVEIMAPIMSQTAFARLVETFDKSISGYGLDIAWPKLLGDPRNCIAILDSVQMRHAKKIDYQEGPFYKLLRSLGVNPMAELDTMRTLYDLDADRDTLREYGAVDKPGPRPQTRMESNPNSARPREVGDPNFQEAKAGFPLARAKAKIPLARE
jgi:hypothetical protein